MKVSVWSDIVKDALMSVKSLPASRDFAAWEALLPTAPAPAGAYVPLVKVGSLLYTSGALPLENGQLLQVGPMGLHHSCSLEAAQHAAACCVMNTLSAITAEYGSLSVIKRVIKLMGFVASEGSFTDQHLVMNGASERLVAIFGESGKHARSAVGVAALPKNATVELELILELVE
jgi:enamine deaminase RidA (YjgF/YER057c/UK114 family)